MNGGPQGTAIPTSKSTVLPDTLGDGGACGSPQHGPVPHPYAPLGCFRQDTISKGWETETALV